MQGQLVNRDTGEVEGRYNPAYAGTTGFLPLSASDAAIQPCVCRDNLSCIFVASLSADTTLRMQGQRSAWLSQNATIRYNPAYAGTTPYAWLHPSSCPIQPCVCRDNCKKHSTRNLQRDTTLRMQGQHSGSLINLKKNRYNPAYAGTTQRLRDSGTNRPIQPCVCRDNSD